MRGGQAGLATCYNPAISADGPVRRVQGAGRRGRGGLYRRSNPPQLNVPAEWIAGNAVTQGWATVSADGRFVAYQAVDGIRLWDGETSSNRLVLANVTTGPGRQTGAHPAISADGSQLAFLVTSYRGASLHLHDRPMDRTEAVAVKPGGGPVAVGSSAGPLLSDDGQTVVFDSPDDSLVEGDANRTGDVFALERGTGLLTCVSVRAEALPGSTAPGSSHRLPGSISADGRRVAVFSADQDAADTNRSHDVYVRDLSGGGQFFLGGLTNSTRYPAPERGRASCRVPVGESERLRHLAAALPASLYRRDLVTGEELLVHAPAIWDPIRRVWPSVLTATAWPFSIGGPCRLATRSPTSTCGTWPRDGHAGLDAVFGFLPIGSNRAGSDDSMQPRFSPDGRWVIFGSKARNLTAVIQDNPNGLFARDLAGQRTLLLSSSSDARYLMAISTDSRHVASVELVPATGLRRITVHDLETRTATPLLNSANARSLSLSAEGRWLACDRASLGGSWNIHVHDRWSQTNELISVQFGTTNAATAHSSDPAISHDGRYVVFASLAPNLVVGDTNELKDVFIRDRLRGLTLLASLNRAGTGSGNGPSYLPVLAADGRTLLFESVASDLVDGDFNEGADVFVLRLGGRDRDGDGLDDDWEAAYFGNLDRDGSGDFDADGSTDAVEHGLATDPTNAGSVFQVLQLSRANGAGRGCSGRPPPGGPIASSSRTTSRPLSGRRRRKRLRRRERRRRGPTRLRARRGAATIGWWSSREATDRTGGPLPPRSRRWLGGRARRSTRSALKAPMTALFVPPANRTCEANLLADQERWRATAKPGGVRTGLPVHSVADYGSTTTRRNFRGPPAPIVTALVVPSPGTVCSGTQSESSRLSLD